ncbi:MAG: hypothetical protein CSB44_00640 [Gammaproteobacteria bacterium]|nr:MAG: hypothetical protein CSB44_00640 [Gammaproteobacteria bacterium]
MSNAEAIGKSFKKFTASRQVHEAVLLVEDGGSGFSVNYGYGGKAIDALINLSSVGKLITTACIVVLQEKNKLSLNDLVVSFYDKGYLNGLHVFKGVDYSQRLRVSDLLFQTSGLPDYEAEGGLMNRALEKDFLVSTDELVEITRSLKPHFAPSGKRAYYSDLNFHLLGEIVEKTAQMPLEDVFQQFIFKPLGLTKTYLPVNQDLVPGVFYKDLFLHRPKLIMSLRGGGNVVTTARELMIFLKAFFGGFLFSINAFEQLSRYRKLQMSMGPICYGGGYMQIPLNGIMTLFMGKGELLGHSGSTGSFAFYYPLKDLFFVGDVNQMANPGLPIRLVMKLAMSVK